MSETVTVETFDLPVAVPGKATDKLASDFVLVNAETRKRAAEVKSTKGQKKPETAKALAVFEAYCKAEETINAMRGIGTALTVGQANNLIRQAIENIEVAELDDVLIDNTPEVRSELFSLRDSVAEFLIKHGKARDLQKLVQRWVVLSYQADEIVKAEDGTESTVTHHYRVTLNATEIK